MNPTLNFSQHAILAMVLFSIANVILDRNFKHVSPLLTMVIYTPTIFTLAVLMIVYNQKNNVPMVRPSLGVVPFIILFGGVSFLADFNYFSAYDKGGKEAITPIMTIVATMPVLVMIIEMLLDRKLPSLYQFLGCVLAPLAVYFAVRR